MSDNRYVLTRYKDGVLGFAIDMDKNRLESVCFCKTGEQEQRGENVGNIYLARVTRVSGDINAAFISYGKDGNGRPRRGFIPLGGKETPVIVNREYDGRLLSGDMVLARLDREAVRSKNPVFSLKLSKGRFAPPSDRIEKIKKDALYSECGSLLWRAPAVYLRQLCNDCPIECGRIVTDDEKLYGELSNFLAVYAPDMCDRLSMYSDATYPLAKLYSIETKLSELLGKKVWLKSGAYLVIEKTEAMYVVDVNSGKNISKKENESYIYDINIEAAHELMRQIRLRNLTGIIIVDFISMENAAYRERLLNELRSLAKKDRVPTSIVDMTALDLVEITRRKNVKPLWDQLA